MKQYENPSLREKYYRFTHKSGLDIYVFPKHFSTAYAVFGTKYGSIDNCFKLAGEKEYQAFPDGIAHYLEHRMFTQADGSDITERFSELGADSNAYTSYTKTVYLFSATDYVEESIEALLRFVTEPHFTEELVERERGIIVQEIRMCEDDPYGCCFDRLMEAMYHCHSVRNNVAGTEASVGRITADMLNSCYRAFYNPKNMVLVVCGDISPETVSEIADRSLPETFVAVDVDRFYRQEPPYVKESLVEKEMQVSKPIFAMGIKDSHVAETPEERIHRCAAMSILCDAIFSKAGDLYNSLFESGRISPDFSCVYSSSETFSFATVSGEADDPLAVCDTVKNYMKELSSRGIPAKDIERSRRALYSEYVKDFDSTEEIANSMIDFIMEGVDLLEYGDHLQNVTCEEIRQLLRSVFKEEYFSVSVVRPKRKEIE